MRFHGVVAMVLVDDIVRALRFYRDILGFTVQEEQEDWVLFVEGVGLQSSPEPAPEVRYELNSVMISLVVESVSSAFEELTGRGVAFLMPPTAEGGIVVASFRDTENNLLQLIQPGA